MAKAKKVQVKVTPVHVVTRKERMLAKHVKANPNDLQAAKHVGKPLATRRTPVTKGNFRTVNKMYRDEAGHVLAAPSFAPETRVAK